MKSVKRACLIGLQVLLFLSAPLAAAAQVVISSTADSIPLGRVLDQGESVAIPAGTSVALLTAGGEVVWLRGPWSGTYDAAPLEPTVSDRLAALLRPAANAGSFVAAFRNVPQSGPWEIDPADEPPRICRAADQPLYLVAGDLGPNDSVWIGAGDADEAIYFRGRRAIDIHPYIRPDDTRLRVRVPSFFSEWQAEIVTLDDPAVTDVPEQLLVALGEHGCAHQFSAMMASLIAAK